MEMNSTFDDLTYSEFISLTRFEIKVVSERSGIPDVVRCYCKSEVTVLSSRQTLTALLKQNDLENVTM